MGYDLQSLNVPAPSDAELERIVEQAVRNAGSHPLDAAQATFDALEGTGCFFRFNFVAWPKLIELAKKHGWSPKGDTDREVSDADARGLADSLERVLKKLGCVSSLVEPWGPMVPNDPLFSAGEVSETVGYGPRADLSPEAFWANNPEKIKRFIKFARQGRFSIS